MKWLCFLSLCIVCNALVAVPANCQNNYQDKIAEWKKQFPKQDAIAYTYKETVTFIPNFSPKPGEGRVKTSVQNEMVLVPLKDYMNYDDAMFYNDEVALEQ